MGMFDTVVLECPNCKLEVDVQTKSGSCILNVYTITNAPMEVMADVEGVNVCYHCQTEFMVEMVQKPAFKVRKLLKEESDPTEDLEHWGA